VVRHASGPVDRTVTCRRLPRTGSQKAARNSLFRLTLKGFMTSQMCQRVRLRLLSKICLGPPRMSSPWPIQPA
jgi:hypothetical protein